MEQNNINIVNILKNYPKGTKLYSPIYGVCYLGSILPSEDPYQAVLEVYDPYNATLSLDSFGKYTDDGEVVLFPSKEMKDWSKLTWKKGDVLKYDDSSNTHIIFDKFTDDKYTSFVGKHYLSVWGGYKDVYTKEVTLLTSDLTLENKDAAQCFINTIEEKLGGKLNLETLEIEDMKPKWTPKPFEKVVAISCADRIWCADIYSHINQLGGYDCIGGNYKKVLPYNEETAKLIGTIGDYNED